MQSFSIDPLEALTMLGVFPRAAIRKPFFQIGDPERARVRQALQRAKLL